LKGLASISFTQGIGLLLLGGIIGAAIFMLVYHHNFSVIVDENHILRNQTIELTEDLDHMRKNEKKQTVIKQIDARLQEDGTQHLTASLKEELEKKVRSSLKIVYEQKITTAKENIFVYEKLITNRNNYLVLDKHFNVTVKFFTLIGTELTVWFTVKEVHLPEPE